jgi:hypothetical protein
MTDLDTAIVEAMAGRAAPRTGEQWPLHRWRARPEVKRKRRQTMALQAEQRERDRAEWLRQRRNAS